MHRVTYFFALFLALTLHLLLRGKRRQRTMKASRVNAHPDCDTTRTLLDRLAEGDTLADSQLEMAEEHLGVCTACSRFACELGVIIPEAAHPDPPGIAPHWAVT